MQRARPAVRATILFYAKTSKDTVFSFAPRSATGHIFVFGFPKAAPCAGDVTARRGRSERGRLVADDKETRDFAVVDREVVRQDQFIRQIGLVVVTVIETVHDDLA